MKRQILGTTAKPYVQGLKVTGGQSLVFISGQIARDEQDEVYAPNDLEQQARYIFTNIEKLVCEAGGTMKNVVKIVAYVTTLEAYGSYGAIRREFFGDHLPTSSTVQVTSLVTPGCVIEIEAIAVL